MRNSKAGYRQPQRQHHNTVSRAGTRAYTTSNKYRYYYTDGTVNRSIYTAVGHSDRTSSRYGYYGNPYSAYNNSSVAEDYRAFPVEKKQHKKVKRASKKGSELIYMPRLIVTVIAVAALLIAVLISNANNSYYREQIASKQAELAEIQEQNQFLKTSLDENVDLNKIAREAEKLGLQRPQAYQITEVNVPNESYTVQYDAHIDSDEKSIWQFIKNLLE